jgi:hypothetical protein
MAEQTKHTPGPWMAWLDEDTNKFSVYRDRGRGVGEWVAEVHGTKGCFQANARLIAAAPDLLSELQALVNAVDGYIEAAIRDGEPVYLASPESARAAIAKARGDK